MSLDDLPDELLEKIAAYTCAAHHHDKVFERLDDRFRGIDLGSGQLASCYHLGVEPLSLTCSRLRRLCLQILFAVVALSNEDKLGMTPIHIMVSERPHIAIHIK
jgi:hypothetical protein